MDHVNGNGEASWRPEEAERTIETEMRRQARVRAGVDKADDFPFVEFALRDFEDGAEAPEWNRYIFDPGEAVDIAVRMIQGATVAAYMVHIKEYQQRLSDEGLLGEAEAIERLLKSMDRESAAAEAEPGA